MLYREKEEEEFEIGEVNGRYVRSRRVNSRWMCSLATQSKTVAEIGKPIASVAILLLISVPLGILGAIDPNFIFELLLKFLTAK